MSEIKIDPEMVRDLVQHAIFEQLTPEGRERLVASAVEQLLVHPEAQNVRYGASGPSLMENAFKLAVDRVAANIVTDMLKDDAAFAEKVKAKLGEALVKLDDAEFSTYAATALAAGLGEKRYS